MNSFSFNSTFPHCPLHKSNYLSWVCLDQNCDTRIFCPHCVILNHKNIHSHFNEFSSILKDPLCQIIGSDFLLQSNREKSLKDILSEYFDSQKDKLRDVLDKILNEIMKKFEDIRIGFQKDVHTFLKQNEVNMNKFDQQRKEYDEFFQNYYLNNNFERERLKEGMDLILSKYNSNENFKKSLAEVLSNVTHVIDKDYKEISMGNIKLHNLSWSYFTDKKMSNFFKNIKLILIFKKLMEILKKLMLNGQIKKKSCVAIIIMIQLCHLMSPYRISSKLKSKL